MTNRHMRVCSTLLIIRENANQNHNEAIIKNKIAVRLLLKKKKRQVLTGCGEKRTLVSTGENINWYSHYGKQFDGSSKN